MRLAVTGISGNVGMRLAEVAVAGGHQVTGLVREDAGEDARLLAGQGVRLVSGDLADLTALAALCKGAEAVIHAAGRGRRGASALELEDVNITGTRNVVEAAARCSARRFVHLSSVAVYGCTSRGRITEERPTKKTGDPYGDSKTEAERLAFRRGGVLGLDVAAVRPPVIYGPRDRTFLPHVMAALRGRRLVLLDGGSAPLNVAWVDHVVDVLLRAATQPEAAGEAFNVMDEVDGHPPSVRQVAETIAREAGLPRPRWSVPTSVAKLAARAFERAYDLAGVEATPPLTSSTVARLAMQVVFDSSKAARVLGWRPQVHALEGLARAARTAVS